MGRTAEPLIPIAHSQPIIARMEFEGGLDSLSDLLQAGKHLLQEILQELRRRSIGRARCGLIF